MSFEQHKEISDAERRQLHNGMQIALITRYFGFKPDNERTAGWIEEHSSAFSNLVKTQPELLVAFRDNPEVALDRAEGVLYVVEDKAVRE